MKRYLKKNYVSILLVLSSAFGFTIVTPQEAQAIPAFARKYNAACNTCHVPSFPKLNDFGNRFRDQGYQMGTDNDSPTHEGISMGYWPMCGREPFSSASTSLFKQKTNGTQNRFLNLSSKLSIIEAPKPRFYSI